MRFARFFIVIIILSMVLSACSALSTQASPTNVLFSDDFSTKEKKWDQVTEAARTTNYYIDAYRIVVNDAKSVVWANPGKESFTDVHIETDATKNGGPDDNAFGVICRYTDVDHFYYAAISSDGYYGIMKMTKDGGTQIGSDSMLETDKVNQGSATNRIRFDCVGSTLTLYVNGTQVDQQTDSDYTAGNVGLMAGTFGTSGTDMIFDNFVVYKP
jgi:hypothetical protein